MMTTSRGQAEFVEEALQQKDDQLIREDSMDLPALTDARAGSETVFYFAATADIRFGLERGGIRFD